MTPGAPTGRAGYRSRADASWSARPAFRRRVEELIVALDMLEDGIIPRTAHGVSEPFPEPVKVC